MQSMREVVNSSLRPGEYSPIEVRDLNSLQTGPPVSEASSIRRPSVRGDVSRV